jgi:hypothetical protein
MKKLIFTLAASLFISAFAMAQSAIGIKAGPNFSNFKLSKEIGDLYNTPMMIGFQAGAAYEITFGGMFGMQIEGYYARRGSGYRAKALVTEEISWNPSTGVAEDFQFRESFKHQVEYIDIPLLLKYNLRGRSVQAALFAGPQLSFATAAIQKDRVLEGTVFTIQVNPDGSESIVDSRPNSIAFDNVNLELGDGPLDFFKKSDFSIVLGLQVGIELDMGQLVFDARYIVGTSNIRNSSNPLNTIHNRSIGINIGYMYPLGGGW